MAYLRPIILALLLAVAGPAAAIPSSAPSIQSSATMAAGDSQVYEPANTSAMMTLGEDADETRAFVQPGLDVGTTLAVEKDAVTRRIDRGTFEAQFAKLESEGDKRDLIFKYATHLQSRTETLEKRETNARRGVRNGSISAAEYVRTIARINEEASGLREEVNLIKSYTDEVEFPLNDYLGSLEKRLISLEGPVREELAGTIRGDVTTNRYYLSVADNGVVLAYLNHGTYYREIYRTDHRSIKDNSPFSSSEMRERTESFYPWARNDDNKKGMEWYPKDSAGYYTYDFQHPHGLISGLVDKSTGLVFQESQQKHLTADAAARNGFDLTMPKGPGVTANESRLLLTVNRSYPGGPMYVALQDNETGDLVEGTVAVDGETVGQTTFDGGLWTLSPAGSFNVTASSGMDVVTVETRATRPIATRNTTQD